MSEKAPRHEFLLLLVLASMQFAHIVDFMVLMPLGPQLQRIMNISPEQFGWLVSIYNFSAAGFGFFMAFTLDRLEKRKVLLYLYTAFLVATLICGFAQGFYTLLISRALVGAFGGVLTALVYSTVADVVPQIRRGAAMGVIVSAFSVASVLGLPIALYLANIYGWRAPFFAIVLAGIPILYLAFKVLPEMPALGVKQTGSYRLRFKKMLMTPGHFYAFRLTAVLVASGFVMIPYLSMYMVTNGGVTEQELPMIYLAGGAATLFTSRFFGGLSDRYGRLRVFTILAIMSLFPALWITNFGEWGIVWASVAVCLFMVFNSGRMIIATTIVSEAVQPEVRAGFMSFNTCFQQMASATAALVAAQLVTADATGRLQHYELTGYIATACTLCALYFAWILLRQDHKSPSVC